MELEVIAGTQLDKYYDLMSRIDKMAVSDALEELKCVAEGLVDCLTDFIYCE